MAEIRVQRGASGDKTSKRDTYAMLCYFYPQFTLQDAKKMPYRDIKLLLKVARREQAIYFQNMTAITASPHSKNGSSVKKLINSYQKQIDG